MYDKIDLYIRDNELLDKIEKNGYAFLRTNPLFVKIGDRDGHKYRLLSKKKHANQHELIVEIYRKTNGDNVSPPVLHIFGSIRKWYYGELSMKDLTRYDTMMAIHRLADAFDIPYEHFYLYPVSSIEFGLNLYCGNTKPVEIFSRMASFKDKRYKSGEWDGNYMRFKTNNFLGKAYDKVEETKNKIKKMKDKHGVSAFLSEYGNKNIMRLEFKAYGGASKTKNYMGIATIFDMISKYNTVAAEWYKYTKLYQFKGTDILPFRPVRKAAKEITDYIRYLGLLAIEDEELKSILAQLPPQARSDANKSISEWRMAMPDAKHTKGVFEKIVSGNLIQHLRKSQQQWVAEPDLVLQFTFL